MAIRFEDVNEGLRRIVLSGRLDTAGSEQIAPKFAELTESAKGGVVVSLSAVKFLSSMAIGVLVKGAKAVQAKGGRMVLHVGDNDVIRQQAKASELIPTFEDGLTPKRRRSGAECLRHRLRSARGIDDSRGYVGRETRIRLARVCSTCPERSTRPGRPPRSLPRRGARERDQTWRANCAVIACAFAIRRAPRPRGMHSGALGQ